jgi:hypothetical protein
MKVLQYFKNKYRHPSKNQLNTSLVLAQHGYHGEIAQQCG